MRDIVQNNSTRWLETVGYISQYEMEGNIGPLSPVNDGVSFAQFPD